MNPQEQAFGPGCQCVAHKSSHSDNGDDDGIDALPMSKKKSIAILTSSDTASHHYHVSVKPM
ncbi:hypothetical protein FH972_025982 [Carpinus fangiana]|uniref:Uncharacterized protein n=1 Tax=Carpinus fangiana TaxID=176857 RepID=A0A5N6L3L0_9ROSI|nr:hypothetical protein FH972_025982 [Carpinus fangiana]